MDTKIVRVVAHYTETLDVYVKVPAHVSDEDVMEHYKSIGANGEFEQCDQYWEWSEALEADEEEAGSQKVWDMIAPFPIPDFPYEEIRDKNGDYFLTLEAAKAAGHEEDNIWVVIINDAIDEETGEEITHYTYTHPRHYVNKIGYVATGEAREHDDEEYYDVFRMPTYRD